MTQSTILPAVFFLLLSSALNAQAPQASFQADSREPAAAVPAVPAPPTVLPSAILRPAMQSIQQALAIARPEKWKAPGAVTAESASDIGSIQRDLNQTLPPLVTTADGSPNSVPHLLPTYRNVEALYDVLVRVTQTSVLAAPAQQSAAFQQATQSLQQARRDFGDLLDSAAQSQDRRFHDVQVKLTALQSAPPPCRLPQCAPRPRRQRSRPNPAPSPFPSQRLLRHQPPNKSPIAPRLGIQGFSSSQEACFVPACSSARRRGNPSI